MDWRKGESIISDETWGTVNENVDSGVPESKVSVLAEWWVQINWTWKGVSEVLGTWKKT
jgi:hypothetical protein